MSFITLFDSYKRLLFAKDLEHKHESDKSTDTGSGAHNLSLNASDIQTATKRIFNVAAQQNTATLQQSQFYESLASLFLLNREKASTNLNNSEYKCSHLLVEIGWDLLTELFLLYSKDNRFERFLYAICWDIAPRELSIMLSEVFCHPMLSINATHHHYQLHTMQNHYILNEEDSEQQKQMLLNLNITNQSINQNASDDILQFHKNINYVKVQQLFIQCIIILFERLTEKKSPKETINYFYQSLIPSAILHFQTLSKEISYQFYLHNTTQYHTHHDHHHSHHEHSHCNDRIKALDATNKQRQEWLINSKKEYEAYLDTIYQLFALMVNDHCDLRHHDTSIKDVPIDVKQLIKLFHLETGEEKEETQEEKIIMRNNLNTLWLARYGFGVLAGVYWWYNVYYSEDAENDGDVNNDSVEVLTNIKTPAYNIFLNDIVDSLKREILVKLCHSVGMNGNVLLSIREYLSAIEVELESLKPWHLNTEQLNQQQTNKSNPSTPTPQLQGKSSIGHLDLNPIIEETQDEPSGDEMMDALQLNADPQTEDDAIKEHTSNINIKNEVMNGSDKQEDDFNDEVALWDDDDALDGIGPIDIGDDDDDDDNFDNIDPTKLKKMARTQQLVDELKLWNEYMELFGVSCYYHSLWVLLQSNDCIQNEGEMFKKHSKHIWRCIHLLFDQRTTLPAGIEFGEFVLKKTYLLPFEHKDRKMDINKLLTTAQFHDEGVWALVQSLTAQLKGISDRALHQKLWKFIVHLINSADLKTRFQCIVSTALQCPIPVVQSLMFTELKNQIFNNWNVEVKKEDDEKAIKASKEEEDEESLMEETLNPFCSRQVVMVLVQRLGKELQNMSLQTINSELDSLNACLNLCRFLLMKDVKTNYTQIYDDDCPLRVVTKSLFEQMTKIADDAEKGKASNDKEEKEDKNAHNINEMQRFQRQMMKNQFLVSLDLVKRIQEMYNK